MDVLTSALWRGVYMSDESVKEPHVRVLAEYVDAELADIYAVDVVRCCGVRAGFCFCCRSGRTSDLRAFIAARVCAAV